MTREELYKYTRIVAEGLPDNAVENSNSLRLILFSRYGEEKTSASIGIPPPEEEAEKESESENERRFDYVVRTVKPYEEMNPDYQSAIDIYIRSMLYDGWILLREIPCQPYIIFIFARPKSNDLSASRTAETIMQQALTERAITKAQASSHYIGGIAPKGWDRMALLDRRAPHTFQGSLDRPCVFCGEWEYNPVHHSKEK